VLDSIGSISSLCELNSGGGKVSPLFYDVEGSRVFIDKGLLKFF